MLRFGKLTEKIKKSISIRSVFFHRYVKEIEIFFFWYFTLIRINENFKSKYREMVPTNRFQKTSFNITPTPLSTSMKYTDQINGHAKDQILGGVNGYLQ
jgi:hypothetical protein